MSSKDLSYTLFPAALGWSILKKDSDVGLVQVIDLGFKQGPHGAYTGALAFVRH